MNSKVKQKQNNNFFSKTNIICFIMFVLLTFIDQLSKQAAIHFLRGHDIVLIPGVLELHYLENRGAAWGIMQDQTWLLLATTGIVLVVILYIFFRLPDNKRFRLLRVCLVLLAAGAFGNFIDRIVNHYVVDFIYVSLIHFPVFNFADCCVCISAVLILYCILFKYKDGEFTAHNGSEEKESDF